MYDIFKLPQICHIAVGEDISPQIFVDDILFVLHAVETESADVLGLNTLGQCFDVCESAPCTVDEHNAFFHLGNRVRIDHVVRLFQERDVEGDRIGLFV